MMHPETGKYIDSPVEQVRVSLVDILTTRKGTLVGNREYGSELLNFVDGPMNNKIDMHRVILEAVDKYEPRIKINSVEIEFVENNVLQVVLRGMLLNTKENVEFIVENK